MVNRNIKQIRAGPSILSSTLKLNETSLGGKSARSNQYDLNRQVERLQKMCHELQGQLEEKAVAVNKLTEVNSNLKQKFNDLIKVHSKCEKKHREKDEVIAALTKENSGLKKRSYSINSKRSNLSSSKLGGHLTQKPSFIDN
jgi:chromosome segregation ATPase